MSGFCLWLIIGVAWWLAALATAIPYRYRHRTSIRFLRATVGLPLTVAAWLEMTRSRRRPTASERRAPAPYRALVPLILSLLAALGLAGVLGVAAWGPGFCSWWGGLVVSCSQATWGGTPFPATFPTLMG